MSTPTPDEVAAAAERLLKWAERHADDPLATRAAKALVYDAGKVAMHVLARHSPLTDDERAMDAALSLQFESGDLGRTLSIREYLIELVRTIWREGEVFSGKRPFGNSGWQYEVYQPLIKAGLVPGKLDEGGWVDECDTKAADKFVLSLIDRLAVETRN